MIVFEPDRPCKERWAGSSYEGSGRPARAPLSSRSSLFIDAILFLSNPAVSPGISKMNGRWERASQPTIVRRPFRLMRPSLQSACLSRCDPRSAEESLP